MTHPMTDEIIAEKLITTDECLRRLEDGRAMYYEEDFRVGADWQLEQVIEWLDGRYLGQDVFSVDIIEGLIEAMRPQENN